MQGSRADYEEALRLKPDLVMGLRGRGMWWTETGEPEKAIEDFDRALQINPQDERSYLGRGMANLQFGNAAAAEADFAEATRLAPGLAGEIAAARKRIETTAKLLK